MTLETIPSLFSSRLSMLQHLLNKAEEHFENDSDFMTARIVEDMFPFATQVVFTCNQPRNFARWMLGEGPDNMSPDIATAAQAKACISHTLELLASAPLDEGKLAEQVHLDLNTVILDMPGRAYLNDFLIANFYFHLVTAYDILRMKGLPIGKADYMLPTHPYVTPKNGTAADGR